MKSMSSKWSLFDHLVGGYKPCEFPVGMDLDSPPARPNALARDRDARQRHRAHVHRHRARLSRVSGISLGCAFGPWWRGNGRALVPRRMTDRISKQAR